MYKHICYILFYFFSSSISFSQNVFFSKLADSTLSLTKQDVVYDPAYFKIPYPNGDVPAHIGVCTDVVIRAYRKLGVDLQKQVHEDMTKNFSIYPTKWGMKNTDKNIDHRRVLNLMQFFTNKDAAVKVSEDPNEYLPGDVVCWDLGEGVTHIGMVIKQKSIDNERHAIVHNIGNGQIIEDCLFKYKIIGHYRYKPKV